MHIDINELENMTLEEIWKNNKIEDLASSLRLEKLDDLRSTINTLSAMACIGNRKDALYLLYGYYMIELKELSEKNIFISHITNWGNYELLNFIIIDLSQYKNLYRYKDSVNKICTAIDYSKDKFSTEQKNSLELIIEDAKWGVKLKNKFLDKLDDADLEQEKYDYLFGDID